MLTFRLYLIELASQDTGPLGVMVRLRSLQAGQTQTIKDSAGVVHLRCSRKGEDFRFRYNILVNALLHLLS